MTQTYHYDVKSQPFPICEAPIYTYDASSPHVHLGVHCRAANSKGKERDSESGNDYAMMRSSVNRLGRFSSPDLLAGSTSGNRGTDGTFSEQEPFNPPQRPFNPRNWGQTGRFMIFLVTQKPFTRPNSRSTLNFDHPLQNT